MEYFNLNDVKLPKIGFGTYKIRGFDVCLKVVDEALKCGYRWFDTAQIYQNEADLGQCFEILLPKYNLKREDIFIVTKIATHNQGHKCVESVIKSMSDLRTNYLDLVLIHWPGTSGFKPSDERNPELRKITYEHLQDLKAEGKLKYIGVSNYNLVHMKELLSNARVKPFLLQSEFHPFLDQNEVIQLCNENSIIFQAYSSLGTSNADFNEKLLKNEIILTMAAKYAKTPAQILLRWAIDQNIGVIPKSTNPVHIRENIEIFDFTLSKSDINLIYSLNENVHFCWNPNTVK